MARKIKVLVNAVTLNNIGTGIGRYLKSLYTEMETLYGDKLEIYYFDGIKVLSAMPKGCENHTKRAKYIDLFWKIPAYPAFLIRLGIHLKWELFFYKVVKKFDIYHEPGFFPFTVPKGLLFTIIPITLPACAISVIPFSSIFSLI